MEFSHYSVMLKETIEELKVKSDGIYVDGTLGGGGHAYEVCKRLSDAGHFYGIDQDAGSHCGSVTETLRIWKSCDDYPQQLLRNV